MFFGRNKSKADDAESVELALNTFRHPALIDGWASHPGIVRLAESGEVSVTIPFAAADLLEELEGWIDAHREGFTDRLSFTLSQRVATLKAGDQANAADGKNRVAGVKNIVVVSSAKGGVGKSTTSVNLALALIAQGAKVGLLDADIYGPSVPLMLGTLGEQPQSLDGKLMEPIQAHGLVTNSIGYLVPEDSAMVWRGPMASKAFAQLVNETRWPDLDYLVVDMPPGTGDIQLSLAQQFPVTAAIVVTTPQDLALADAVKGVTMFDKVSVPVLGVVENMSYHICSQCGHHEAIFGEGGAAKMAQQHELALLAQVPLHIAIREDIDAGAPTVAARPNDEHAQVYRQLASSVAGRLFWQGEVVPDQISITTVS